MAEIVTSTSLEDSNGRFEIVGSTEVNIPDIITLLEDVVELDKDVDTLDTVV